MVRRRILILWLCGCTTPKYIYFKNYYILEAILLLFHKQYLYIIFTLLYKLKIKVTGGVPQVSFYFKKLYTFFFLLYGPLSTKIY